MKGQSKYASRLDTCEVSTFYFLNKGFAAVRSKVNNAAEGELHEEVGTGGVQAVSVRGRIGQVRWSCLLYTSIITAQQSLLSAQLNEVSDTFQRMQAVINLYSALGGGRE